MIFKFTGKGLYIVAGIICCITVIGIPFGIMFFYMAGAAHVEIDDVNFMYKMLFRKVIPLTSITKLWIDRTVVVYRNGMEINRVIPLVVEYDDKKLKFSLNYFENPDGILDLLEQKTGLKIQQTPQT